METVYKSASYKPDSTVFKLKLYILAAPQTLGVLVYIIAPLPSLRVKHIRELARLVNHNLCFSRIFECKDFPVLMVANLFQEGKSSHIIQFAVFVLTNTVDLMGNSAEHQFVK